LLKEARTLLLLGMDGIGDVIMTTACLKPIRSAFPEVKIVYAVKNTAAAILDHNPCLDEVIPFDKPFFSGNEIYGKIN